MNTPLIPFKFLILAPFKPNNETYWSSEPIAADINNIDQVIEDLGISLYIPVPVDLCKSGSLNVDIKRFKDFHPDSLIKTNPFLKRFLDAKEFLKDAKIKSKSNEEIINYFKEWADIPIKISSFQEKEKVRSATTPIDNILKMVSFPDEGPQAETGQLLLAEQIDNVIKKTLTHIFSDKGFRGLEAVWQGLKLLLKQVTDNGRVLLEIVPVSADTIEETLKKLIINMIKDPPSFIIVDIPFDNSPVSLELLKKIADFSETLLTPSLCWINPHFFYLNSWDEIMKLSYLPHYFEEMRFAKWRRFKNEPSSKWLALTCNRFLTRYKYGPDNNPKLVTFTESEPLWVSPVWAIGCLIAKSLAMTGWPTRFTEWNTIKIEGLGLDLSNEDKSYSTEFSFSEDRIYQFMKCGFIPLMSIPEGNTAFTVVDVTVTEGTLSHQLFVSQMIRLLLWCRDNFRRDLAPSELEENLKGAFSLFWQKRGYPGPKSLEIFVSKTADEKRLVNVLIEPSYNVLPAGEKAELEFYW